MKTIKNGFCDLANSAAEFAFENYYDVGYRLASPPPRDSLSKAEETRHERKL
jgi:hypothetical protein